ncbi:MAG: DUF3987 domain-containing protein [Stenomitos frigidus ULC029]
MPDFLLSSIDGSCPTCNRNHDKDCRWTADLNLVLCWTKARGGTTTVSEPPDEVQAGDAVYRTIGLTEGGDWMQYRLMSVRQEKAIRPNGKTSFDYRCQAGEVICRVTRTDKDGKKDFSQLWRDPVAKEWEVYTKTPAGKWQSDFDKARKAKLYTQILPYRMHEIRALAGEMVRNGKTLTVLVVEGEGLADLIWEVGKEFGLVGTSFIGGAGKYGHYGYPYEKHLRGDWSLILAPDMDQHGVDHMEDVSQDLPQARWFYPYGDSAEWTEGLRKDGGLDTADWLNEMREAGTRNQEIVALILTKAERKRIVTATGISTTNGKGSIKKPLGKKLTKHQVMQEIDRLLNLSLLRSELEAELADLAVASNRQVNSILNQYNARFREQVEAIAIQESINDLPSIRKIQETRLNLYEVMHHDVAQSMHETAKQMQTAPEFLFTSSLPAFGSRIGTTSRLVIKASAKYTTFPIFQTAIIAPSGAKKTPAQKVVLDPLKAMEAEAHEEWKKQSDAYEAYLEKKANAETGEKVEKVAKPGVRKRYVLDDSTPEAKVKAHIENPRGLLIYRDEAKAHFTSRGKYRNGVGDDTEMELAEFNGAPISVDRVGKSLYLPRSSFSKTGAFQWETLRQLMHNHDDSNGEFARWLFCAAPVVPSPLNLVGEDADVDTGIDLVLRSLYENLGNLEGNTDGSPRDYFLSDNAKFLAQAFLEKLNRWTLREWQPGLKTAYPKFETYLFRIALTYHLTDAAMEGDYTPAQMLSADTLRRAIITIEYFIGQLRLVYALNSPGGDENVKLLMEIDDFAHGFGDDGISVYECYRKFGKIQVLARKTESKNEATITLELFNRLETAGFGRVIEPKPGKYRYVSTRVILPDSGYAAPPEQIQPPNNPEHPDAPVIEVPVMVEALVVEEPEAVVEALVAPVALTQPAPAPAPEPKRIVRASDGVEFRVGELVNLTASVDLDEWDWVNIKGIAIEDIINGCAKLHILESPHPLEMLQKRTL